MRRHTTFLALIFAGCMLAPRHANIAAYEKDLHLSIRPAANAVNAGSRLQIDFTLENTGNHQLSVCRYGDSAVHFWGLEAKYAKTRLGPVVDHQYCEVTMSIAPHERVLWSETVEVPSVQAGPSKVMVTVRLVDPTDCDRTVATTPLYLRQPPNRSSCHPAANSSPDCVKTLHTIVK